MLFDFHTHTTYSDGTLTPEALISRAHERGIKTIAVTDHDTISSYQQNLETCNKYGIELIMGIEISSRLEGKDVHILAYFAAEADFFRLKELESTNKSNREERLFRICENLKSAGIIVDPEIILSKNQEHGTIGRPHIAREIVAAGYASSVPEVFEKFLGDNSKHYLPSSVISATDIISKVREYNGTPVLAHPAGHFMKREDLIKEMIEAGLQGIEVYYPAHNLLKRNHYLNLARKYNLVATGGSDYHGPNTGREDHLGKINIPEAEYLRLKERIKLCSNN